jgi:hypothetical protein
MAEGRRKEPAWRGSDSLNNPIAASYGQVSKKVLA